MFKEERSESLFSWDLIGDIGLGRPNLGPSTSVAVYRLMQFTLRDVMIAQIGVEKTEQIFYDAGKLAGEQLYQNVLTKKDNFEEFISELEKTLIELKIGILRIEKEDLEGLNFTVTVAEDLDCSGLPVCSEEICTYDEGFLNGIFSSFTGATFKVKEVDCWCSGDRTCRFDVKSISTFNQ